MDSEQKCRTQPLQFFVLCLSLPQKSFWHNGNHTLSQRVGYIHEAESVYKYALNNRKQKFHLKNI